MARPVPLLNLCIFKYFQGKSTSELCAHFTSDVNTVRTPFTGEFGAVRRIQSGRFRML